MTPANADIHDLVGIGTRTAGVPDGIPVGVITVGAVLLSKKKKRNHVMNRPGARQEFRNHRNHEGIGVPVKAGRRGHPRVRNHNGEGRE